MGREARSGGGVQRPPVPGRWWDPRMLWARGWGVSGPSRLTVGPRASASASEPQLPYLQKWSQVGRGTWEAARFWQRQDTGSSVVSLPIAVHSTPRQATALDFLRLGTPWRVSGCQLWQTSMWIFLVRHGLGGPRGLTLSFSTLSTSSFLFFHPQLFFFLECEFLKLEGVGNGEAGTEAGGGAGGKQRGRLP